MALVESYWLPDSTSFWIRSWWKVNRRNLGRRVVCRCPVYLEANLGMEGEQMPASGRGDFRWTGAVPKPEEQGKGELKPPCQRES